MSAPFRIALLAGVAACGLAPLLLASCLCPPCPVAAATTASNPSPTGGFPGTAPAAGSAAPGPGRLVIWDGEKAGSGQGWASCNKKGECQSVLAKTGGAGVNGSTALKWHGAGPDWMGAGWNWMAWYPPGSGTDLSAYPSLTFQVRFEAKSPDLAPDGDSLAFGLTCSAGQKCTTARVPLRKYVAEYADGQWHKVVIPMDDLMTGEGTGFDKKKVWEFDFSEWSGAPRDFTVYVDDIAFEK
ncbi:MAG: hypothetical protein JOZ69_18950 [Myxococcales bacterium]|nr:hypothetical protein [Myxococcales bacterium]